MSADTSRAKGFRDDIARRLREFDLGDLQVIARCVLVVERLERDDPGIDSEEPLTAALLATAREIAAEDRELAEAHERARDEVVPRPTCTGLTARWCPRCGDCKCDRSETAEMNSPDCPLHAPTSKHADVDAESLREFMDRPSVDSDAPIGTYLPRVRLVVDEPTEPNERGGEGG